MILAGQTYFNIDTQANPDGEARGQLATVLMTSGASGPEERPAPISTAIQAAEHLEPTRENDIWIPGRHAHCQVVPALMRAQAGGG